MKEWVTLKNEIHLAYQSRTFTSSLHESIVLFVFALYSRCKYYALIFITKTFSFLKQIVPH